MERFGVPKSNQNRSKIGLKSDHEANAKILKIIDRGGVFEHAAIRKAIKNQQKFNQNQKKINQNSILEGLGAIWAPQIRFGTDLDTSWGSTWGRF